MLQLNNQLLDASGIFNQLNDKLSLQIKNYESY